MDHVNYFKDLFEIIPDYTKLVVSFLNFKKDTDFLIESGYIKNDINSLFQEFEYILLEQNGEYLIYIENEEESFLEMIFYR